MTKKVSLLQALLISVQCIQVIEECCNADYGDYQRKKDVTIADCEELFRRSEITAAWLWAGV